MTLDGGVPDLEPRRMCAESTGGLAEASGPASRLPGAGVGPAVATERIRRIRLALRRAHVDLLRAHTVTVAALGRIGVDREHMRDALLEARRQHEALYLVRKAVDALTTPVCPAAG